MLADFEPPHGFWLAEFLDTYLAACSGKLVGPGRIQAAVSEGPEDVQVNHTGTQYRGLTQDPCTEIGVQDGAYCGTGQMTELGPKIPTGLAEVVIMMVMILSQAQCLPFTECLQWAGPCAKQHPFNFHSHPVV